MFVFEEKKDVVRLGVFMEEGVEIDILSRGSRFEFRGV